ncbi:DUF7504 family protein [Halopiger goleimassiliensis]|uniref:DUF7504 family protein n=1 Tax=Halopiger goleimassiliensis TaxID=1293048 RepID=UPI000677CC56|nr:hypothetical protein [Halopiger goleimassiliensis]
MVFCWTCDRCRFTVWAAQRSIVRSTSESHLLEHYKESLYEEGFRFGWTCPHCETGSIRHDVDDAVGEFKRHLFEHERDRLRSGAHVADRIDGTGNVLVCTRPNSSDADNARLHMLAPCNVVLLVTTAVGDRLRALAERLSEWPARTIVLTTAERPLADVSDLDLSSVPLEIVKLDSSLSLSALGETISRVVAEHNGPNRKLSVGFDVLSEIIAKYELRQVFKFLHLLTARLESADALSHFYYDPDSNSGPTLNLIAELFDVRIEATNGRFVTKK